LPIKFLFEFGGLFGFSENIQKRYRFGKRPSEVFCKEIVDCNEYNDVPKEAWDIFEV